MIILQHKNIGVPNTFVKLTIKDKKVTAEVTYKEEETEKVMKAEKDLAGIENSLFILLADKEQIMLLDGYRFSESYRDRLLYLREMFNKKLLLIIKVGKKTQDAKELNLLIENSSVLKENFTLNTDNDVLEEEPELPDGVVFSKFNRKKIHPCYALVLNGQEYQADDEGTLLNAKDIIVPYTGDNITLRIKKYDYEFGKVMNDADDTDKVYIETTCGIINARMTYLENGEKHLVFNPLDYEGAFTIKIGWRWNPVVNQYNLILKKVEGKGE